MNETAGRAWFAGQGADYARYRPRYPEALFDHLAGLAPTRGCAWDCGCGTGQAAHALATRFDTVVASDVNLDQLRALAPTAGLVPVAAAAEAAPLAPGSVDLVCVAQALHWFDLERFYAEVARVVRSGGVLAVWSYNLLSVTPAVDAVIHALYHERLAGCWPNERRRVETGYRDLPFLPDELAVPPFALEAQWDRARLLGYLGTWSAVRRCRTERGEDPLVALDVELAVAWGGEGARPIRWPLSLRVARIGG